jgi:hypothetical protein
MAICEEHEEKKTRGMTMKAIGTLGKSDAEFVIWYIQSLQSEGVRL